MAPVREEEESGNVELELNVPEDNGGAGMALQDSDSEPEEFDKHELITDAMGWNVSFVVLVKHYFHWTEAFSRRWQLFDWLRNSQPCMKSLSLLSCSQQLVIRSLSELD